MNKVVLSGNLTKDPEKRTTSQGTSVTSFTVACRKKVKNADGNYQAEFISCVAWRQTADFIANYFKKGSAINAIGSMQTRSYDDKDGNKRYVTEVVVDEVEFGASGSKSNASLETKALKDVFSEELEAYQPIEGEGLPF